MEEYNYTIIIPHKNVPKLLQRCLGSIPERPDVQVIVVDDNSAPTIVDFENFPGKDRKNTEIYLTKEGKGAGYARNVGLRHAKGKWLLFADADDYYIPNAFSVMDANLNEGIDVLYFNIDSDNITPKSRVNYINRLYDAYARTNDAGIVKYGCWTPWNKVLSHRHINSLQLSFDEIPVGNDAIFGLTASKQAKQIKIISNKLYCLTDSPNSLTFRTTSFNRTMDYLYINMKIDKFLIDVGYSNFCLNVLTPRLFFSLLNQFGLKQAFKYLNRLHLGFGVRNAIKLWYILKKNT